MARYLAYRIYEGALDYSFVVSRRPDLKDGIDKELKVLNMEHLIVEK